MPERCSLPPGKPLFAGLCIAFACQHADRRRLVHRHRRDRPDHRHHRRRHRSLRAVDAELRRGHDHRHHPQQRRRPHLGRAADPRQAAPRSARSTASASRSFASADRDDARHQRRAPRPPLHHHPRLPAAADAEGAAIPRRRPPRSGAGHALRLGGPDACRLDPGETHRLRPLPLCHRQQPDGGHALRGTRRADDHHRLCDQRRHRRPRRHPSHRLRQAILSRHGQSVPLHLDRGGGDRRRLDPRRQRLLSRHHRRRLRLDDPHRPPADLPSRQRRAAGDLRHGHSGHGVAGGPAGTGVPRTPARQN